MRLERKTRVNLDCFIKSQFKIFSTILAFSLLSGVFFVPANAKANFFSYLWGTRVSADIMDSLNAPINSNQNSQTMALLDTSSFSVSTIQDKQDKSPSKDNNINENINILSDIALVPVATPINPASESFGIGGGDIALDQISVYVVREGDTLSQIADMFGVSVNTILAANDMKKGEKLVVGDTLFILPISGIEHTVAKGQTLKSIATLYKVDITDITLYNGIEDDAVLAIGDKLIIPGGDMIDEGGDKPASNLSATEAKDRNYYASNPIRSVAGYFVNPLPTGRKTQGLHGPGRRGIDIGAPTGTPIYAAASGTVLIAKTGWSGGYGNMAIIQHSNGTKTLYAHMSKLGTRTGAGVSQGEIIGYVGSTGRSTGPHLHFEVFNAKNPGVDWSWAK